MVMTAWRAQPLDVGPIRAFRNAMVQVFQGHDFDPARGIAEPSRLLFSVPELRQAAINELLRSGKMVTDELAVRLGPAGRTTSS